MGYLYWEKAQQRFCMYIQALFAQSISGIMQKKWIKGVISLEGGDRWGKGEMDI